MKRIETNFTGCDRRGGLAALRKSMRNITRSCPAPVHVVVDANLLDLLLRAGSVSGRGGQQGGHRDIESLGHGRQVVDRPPRPAPKSHRQRRLAQTHLGRQGLLADTSARHPSSHLSGHSRAQPVHCGLSNGSTIGGPLCPGTHPGRGSSALPTGCLIAPYPQPGCLLALIHSPLSHRLIDRYKRHFMIWIRIPAQLNMADHDTTWGLT